MSILESFKLEGLVAVVTGAGAGIGRAIVELFSKAGAEVVVNDLKAEAAKKVADTVQKSGGSAVAVPCNVTEDAARKQMVERALDAFGKITILVNNAGGGGAR